MQIFVLSWQIKGRAIPMITTTLGLSSASIYSLLHLCYSLYTPSAIALSSAIALPMALLFQVPLPLAPNTLPDESATVANMCQILLENKFKGSRFVHAKKSLTIHLSTKYMYVQDFTHDHVKKGPIQTLFFSIYQYHKEHCIN